MKPRNRTRAAARTVTARGERIMPVAPTGMPLPSPPEWKPRDPTLPPGGARGGRKQGKLARVGCWCGKGYVEVPWEDVGRTTLPCGRRRCGPPPEREVVG